MAVRFETEQAGLECAALITVGWHRSIVCPSCWPPAGGSRSQCEPHPLRAALQGLLDGSAHYTRPAAAAGAQLPGRALLSGAAGGSRGQEEHRGDLKQQIMVRPPPGPAWASPELLWQGDRAPLFFSASNCGLALLFPKPARTT